jgi:pyruvate dehydrogenase E2 component (dihydrolipoamide acetyltransferase)
MANTIDIVVPDLGDFENVEIIEVLVAPGDGVAREDGLITLETDKASFDVPAPESGVVESLTVGVGDSVSTGDVIGKLTVMASDTAAVEPAIAETPTGETTTPATPAGAQDKSGGKQTLVVPDLGDFDEVEVIEVHIAAGNEVEVEDPLVTLETDKAAMDVPAVVAGTIESVMIKVGEKVSAGAALAIIDAVAGDVPTKAPEAAKPEAPAQATAPSPAPDRPAETRASTTCEPVSEEAGQGSRCQSRPGQGQWCQEPHSA